MFRYAVAFIYLFKECSCAYLNLRVCLWTVWFRERPDAGSTQQGDDDHHADEEAEDDDADAAAAGSGGSWRLQPPSQCHSTSRHGKPYGLSPNNPTGSAGLQLWRELW